MKIKIFNYTIFSLQNNLYIYKFVVNLIFLNLVITWKRNGRMVNLMKDLED